MIVSPVAAPLRITQHFGERPEVYKKYGLDGHNGVDFTGQTPGEKVSIHTPYDAKVVQAEEVEGYGLMVRIETPVVNGKARQLVLAHLSELYVRKGDNVPLGNKIAQMGNTGHSSGVHLHLGLRYLDARGRVLDYGNGYKGYTNFEPYLLFWYQGNEGVEYPYDS